MTALETTTGLETTRSSETTTVSNTTRSSVTTTVSDTTSAMEITTISDTSQAPIETCKCLFKKNISESVSLRVFSESPSYD